MQYERERYLLFQHIDPVILKKLKSLGDSIFIAGGAITSVFSSSKINDIDIYFRNSDAIWELTKFFNKSKKSYLSFETTKARSYIYNKNKIYQLIIHPNLIKDNINDLFDCYDYTICMGAFDFKKNEFYFSNDFHHHLAQKRLVYNVDTKYPICSLMRIKKFLDRDYKISFTELIKIALSIHNLDLQNLAVLKDQLEGIDTIFLKPLMDKLQEKEEQEYDFREFLGDIDNIFKSIYNGKIKLKDNDYEL